MKHFSHLNTAVRLIGEFTGQEPFAMYLKKFFLQHRKYGSSDRKQISHLCYCYFRLGKAAQDWTIGEAVVRGLFLCSSQPNEMLLQLKPAWQVETTQPIKSKLALAGIEHSALFPWKEDLSSGIDFESFTESFFVQPDLFLRLRPQYKESTIKKIEALGVPFKKLSPSCIALPNATKIDSHIALNREAVVQDYNSQRAGEIGLAVPDWSFDSVWDCCAASGGKSIMVYDQDPNIKLTVSDVRPSILANLRRRFAEAGIENYHAFVADLTQYSHSAPGHERPGRPFPFPTLPFSFSLIIADVPCTGSGTWGRTPEQLLYFQKDKIEDYATLQQNILSNVIPCLQPGGHLLYITCSVFRRENEDQVEYMKQQFGLAVEKSEVLKGYHMKADTMFVALLCKRDIGKNE